MPEERKNIKKQSKLKTNVDLSVFNPSFLNYKTIRANYLYERLFLKVGGGLMSGRRETWGLLYQFAQQKRL